MKLIDTRLLGLVVGTAVIGFGTAHLNGVRVQNSFSLDEVVASTAYWMGFSQGANILIVGILVTSLGFVAITRLKSDAANRLAAQLSICVAVFAALSFAVFASLSGADAH